VPVCWRLMNSLVDCLYNGPIHKTVRVQAISFDCLFAHVQPSHFD
jgi:hypothetical protein